MSKGVQIVLGVTAIALLVGWYAARNLADVGSFRYYETLVEFQQAGMPDQLARVHGYVATGSIARDVAGKQVHFRIQSDPPHAGNGSDLAMAVEFLSLELPDLFKDGAEVVVEGKMDHERGEPVFVAETVLAKCPSKFQAAENGEASDDPASL